MRGSCWELLVLNENERRMSLIETSLQTTGETRLTKSERIGNTVLAKENSFEGLSSERLNVG